MDIVNAVHSMKDLGINGLFPVTDLGDWKKKFQNTSEALPMLMGTPYWVKFDRDMIDSPKSSKNKNSNTLNPPRVKIAGPSPTMICSVGTSPDIDFSQISMEKQSIGYSESMRDSGPINANAGPLATRQAGGNYNINISSDPMTIGREVIRESKEVTIKDPGSQRFTDAKNESNSASHRISKAPTNHAGLDQS
jgi:hypothetical protein